LDRDKRRIDLTMMGIGDEMEDEPEDEEPAKTAMEVALHRARAQQRERGHRHGKRRPDLSEQEDILNRTLKQHPRR
ncbi:MAG TPA: hypothetical protein VMY80_06620, partial [Anaerolineae bacterium]|nr:hypothetical protein [Anaerolineae bacterium]